MPDRPNVLIAYGLTQWPLRSTIRDHLTSFRKYGRSRFFYLNLGVRRVPRWLRRVPFDAVIFHHTLTGQRMQPPVLAWQLRKAEPLRQLAPLRIAMIQDECVYTDAMSHLIEEFEIDHVFSMAPASERRKIYSGVDHDRVRFHQQIPGYLDPDTVARIDAIVADTPERPIDIGYRAWAGLLSLGRHGLLRRKLAEAFSAAGPKRGLRTDISTDLADVHHGDEWFRFLARCKYMIGAEGSATVLDRTGEFKRCTDAYLAEHPGASYEEVEAACFPGEDGKLALFAISPRHLEACATRTCQVLVEGSYSGVLRAGEHYIELRRDLSNVDEVTELIARDELRERITEAAYRDVVASGRYSYGRMVTELESVTGLTELEPAAADSRGLRARHRLAELADRLSWVQVFVIVKTVRAIRATARALLPRRTFHRLNERLGGDPAAHPGGP